MEARFASHMPKNITEGTVPSLFRTQTSLLAHVSRKFFSIAGFPKVIGALDGTFVRIVSPGGEDAERFRCQKNYFALNVQTIVDSDLVIRNVVARWPGSAHYSTVFNNSAACLSLKINALYKDFHLLGDTAMHVKNIY
ncbi:nuclease HARBI1 [Trichonephila clavipes]|nr:nuclease HARBI1 [Trichonephila clavipes]